MHWETPWEAPAGCGGVRWEGGVGVRGRKGGSFTLGSENPQSFSRNVCDLWKILHKLYVQFAVQCSAERDPKMADWPYFRTKIFVFGRFDVFHLQT